MDITIKSIHYLVVSVLLISLASCENETQNRVIDDQAIADENNTSEWLAYYEELINNGGH